MIYGFEPFLSPMHLGPKTGPLCPAFYARLKEPCWDTEMPDGPHTWFLNIFRVQKEGTQVNIPE